MPQITELSCFFKIIKVLLRDVSHTGTGRFAWLTMRPMSLYESEESNGSVSLLELFKNPKTINGVNNLTLEDIAFLCSRGGWPRSILWIKILL